MNLHIFDIDDTLCKDSELLSKDTIAMLKNLKNKTGNDICFASARGWQTTIDALHNDPKLTSSLITTENGGNTFHINKNINKNTFPKKLLSQIFKHILKNHEHILFLDFWYKNKLITFNPLHKSTPVLENKHRVIIKNLEEIIKYNSISMINLTSNMKPSFHKKISFYEKNNNFTLLPPKINKAIIFNEIPQNASQINIYGNGDNDIELFKFPHHLPTILHSVGTNKVLKSLSNYNFRTPNKLIKYITINLL